MRRSKSCFHPAGGRDARVTLDPALCFEVVDGERLGVVFGFGGVEFYAVEEGFGVGVGAAVRVADFLHGVFVNVGAHDLFGDAGVIDGAIDQTPAAVLAEEPGGVFELGVM